MKLNINKRFKFLMPSIAIVSLLASCNKDLPEAEPITQPTVNLPTIMETLNDPKYSFLKAAVTRASSVPSATGSLSALLADKNTVFTFFAPDDNAFKLSLTALGLPPDIAAINFFRPGQLDTIIKYHLIGGQKYASTITPAAPSNNLYLQSALLLSPPSAALPPGLRMPIFPGKQGPAFYVNNLPVITADIAVANGVIHNPLAIVLAPSRVLADTMYRVADLTYYKAAIARADSGQPAGLTRFDSLLKYPATNMTVLAPNDAAFRTLIYGLVYGKVLALTGDPATADAMATGAVAAGPAFLSTNNISTAEVRGIMAYHFLASNPKGAYEPNYRAFSVNFSGTPTSVKTLVNSSFAPHPGILATATFTGPMVSALQFSSYGSFPPGGAPFSYTANTVGMDRHAVNGVFHIIDKVLLPQ